MPESMLDRRTLVEFPDSSVLVVTGAASGIGRAIAVGAGAMGLAVAAWDIDADGLDRLRADVAPGGSPVVTLRVDVTDEPAVRTSMRTVEDELGPPTLLVNNAGPSSYDGLAFDDGLLSSVSSMRAVTEAWLASDGSRDGSVVNISSIAGALTGGAAADWYPTAKAAIVGYTRQLAVTRPNGIRANAVAPGFTRTPRAEAFLESERGAASIERTPMRRAATPEEISSVVLFLLSPAASYVNGVLLPVDGGSTIVL